MLPAAHKQSAFDSQPPAETGRIMSAEGHFVGFVPGFAGQWRRAIYATARLHEELISKNFGLRRQARYQQTGYNRFTFIYIRAYRTT